MTTTPTQHSSLSTVDPSSGFHTCTFQKTSITRSPLRLTLTFLIQSLVYSIQIKHLTKSHQLDFFFHPLKINSTSWFLDPPNPIFFSETGILCMQLELAHCVDQVGMELRGHSLSASPVLGLMACATTAQLLLLLFFVFDYTGTHMQEMSYLCRRQSEVILLYMYVFFACLYVCVTTCMPDACGSQKR